MIQPRWARNWPAGSRLSEHARRADSGAYYFDGRSPIKHLVSISFARDALTIYPADGGEPIICPYGLTRRIEPFTPREHLALRPNDVSGARLVITDPALIAQFQAHAPEIFAPPFLNRSRILRWSAIGATMLAAVLVFTVVIPAATGLFAFLVPDTMKRSVGASTVKQVFEPLGLCTAPKGQAILDTLTGDLASRIGLDAELNIHVAKVPIVNAFALPGRHLVLTRKLLEKAESSAELAAVIAHELGHAKLGHPTEAYFRRGLVSAVTDALFGGGFVAGGMESVAALAITFGYSREDETAADIIAINALNDAEITAQGMVDFFSRSSESESGLGNVLNKLDWLSTHPSDGERRKRAAELGTGRNQALSPDAWRALKEICG